MDVAAHRQALEAALGVDGWFAAVSVLWRTVGLDARRRIPWRNVCDARRQFAPPIQHLITHGLLTPTARPGVLKATEEGIAFAVAELNRVHPPSAWVPKVHRGPRASCQRIDGLLMRRCRCSSTTADSGYCHEVVIAGLAIPLAARRYEEARREVDERFPLPSWWAAHLEGAISAPE